MDTHNSRVVTASRLVHAQPEAIFAAIADPSRQPEWDGNDNLTQAAGGQRVRKVGDTFSMTLTTGATRMNHVVEFEEGKLIAWKPSPLEEAPPGHLWRWELTPEGDATRVTHTYDWTDLRDEARLPRARATRAENLRASIDRLADLVE
ncbi:SRPBCC family protein [Rothia halotolerans]|uniref:SRPBCC family protein n=1 Tax=Rothia halotolerans TaxID=405770 RepID=UPI00101BF387|nr:SRPBCC family protein [Rothia halotolerans]